MVGPCEAHRGTRREKHECSRADRCQRLPIAVVATGSSIEASVLITTNLVDMKIPQIWAKAISESHGKILTRIGAHRVIYPEREAGERVLTWCPVA